MLFHQMIKFQQEQNVIKALKEINWREKGKTISVRINSLDTHYMYSDLVEIVEQAGDKLTQYLFQKQEQQAMYIWLIVC